MKTYEIERSLNSYIGSEITFRGKAYRPKSYEIKDRYVKIETATKPLVIFLEDLSEAINEIQITPKPQEPMSEEKKDNSMVVTQTTQQIGNSVMMTTAKDLKDILMDNIKRVQDNKEYIPQAKSVNDSVKSIIDLAKAEIEMIKTLKS